MRTVGDMSQLDHVIIAAPDLKALADEFHQRTGIRPVPGGRHEGLGTANQLVGLGDGRYIELIGPDPDQPAPGQPRPLRVDDVTETTVVGWAVRPDDIDALVASARTAGYDPRDAEPMSRRTPDGDVVVWRLTPPAGGFDGAVPFLIDWADTPHPSHDLAGAALLSLVIHHPDADGVRSALEAVGATPLVAGVSTAESVRLQLVLDTPKGEVRFG